MSQDPERLLRRQVKLSQRAKVQSDKSGKSTKQFEFTTKACVICSSPFLLDTRFKRQTCSDQCYSRLCSERISQEPNCGGETNYYHYKYRDIHMDSQWEVDIAIWMDEHNVVWKRDRSIMFRWTDTAGKRHRYYPDFYLPQYDLYLDPKNKYLITKDTFKINAVIKEHSINLIWGLKEAVLNQLRLVISHTEGAIEPERLQSVSNQHGE